MWEHATPNTDTEEPPNQIYLQWFSPMEEVTWCVDRIEDDDVKYVHAGIIKELLQQRQAAIYMISNLLDEAITYGEYVLTKENMEEMAKLVGYVLPGE